MVLILGVVLCGCARKKPPAKPAAVTKPAAVLTEQQRALNVESFDYIWTTVRDKHWDPKLNGIDWNAVRVELRPKVEQAKSMGEARAVMTDMVERLGESHFGIIPASVYRDLDAQRTESSGSGASAGAATVPSSSPTRPSAGQGDSGISLRVIGNRAIVVKVDPGTPAEKAGVRPGWEIESVDSRSVGEMLERIRKTLPDSSMLPFMLAGAAEALLSGPVGQARPVTFLDGKNQKITKEIELAERTGVKANFGNLPTMYVVFEARRIQPNIGYIALNTFFDMPNVIAKFSEAMKEFRDADGIILDLRGNPGGLGGMAIALGGFLVTQPDQKLGTMQMRAAPFNFVLHPRAGAYAGPLAVLVDELSMSTSEVLAGGLQDLKRARVFGTATPGAALPSVVERLPNGDGFQYVVANYVSVGGKTLEGHGVVPDQIVPLDRQALLDGRDPVIEAAVKWIESQKRK